MLLAMSTMKLAIFKFGVGGIGGSVVGLSVVGGMGV